MEFAPGSGGVATVAASGGLNLKVILNGHGPFDGVFDTGSINLMPSTLAKRLGLKTEGNVTMSAMGGNVPAQFAEVDSVQIGGVTLHHQRFVVFDPPPFTQGQDFIMIGDSWLKDLVITVDFEKQQITFADPQQFHAVPGDARVPVRQDPLLMLLAEGNIDGITGTLMIDTGNMYSLLLNAPFVAQHGLVKRYGATIHGYAGEGWGGADSGYYTRVGVVQMGQARIERPIAVLLDDTKGAGISSVAGNVGLRLLRKFTLVFDCPHGAMYLKKNRDSDAPDIFNRAGLALDPDPEKLAVKMIVPGSPAAEAGLAVDDVITQIDDRTPTDETLESAFAQPAGTRVRLRVDHAGKTRDVVLKLTEVL